MKPLHENNSIQEWKNWPPWIVKIKVYYKHFEKTLHFKRHAQTAEIAEKWVETFIWNTFSKVEYTQVLDIYDKDTFREIAKSNPDSIKSRTTPKKKKYSNY